MSYDSNGNFTPVPSYLAVTGQVIQPSQHNPVLEDMCSTGLSAVYVKDGRAAMTGNVNAGGFQVKNVAAGTLSTDAVTRGQMAWELISDTTITAQASVPFPNLSAFRMLRLSGFLFPSVAGNMYLQVSTDNGATYDTTTNYQYQLLNSAAATSAPLTGGLNAITLTGFNNQTTTVDDALELALTMDRFNKATRMVCLSSCFGNDGAQRFTSNGGQRHLGLTARNAFKLIPNSGTLTGQILLEGVRG